MNILVGYQIPYSQAKIDNTHLNRHKWRLAAKHYIYSMKNMKTTEIKNIIQNELPLILGRLSDETIDNILVERDDNFFSEQWMQAYNEVEKQKKQQGVPSTYNEDIRKIVFNMVLEITNNDDLAAYISDDFGLIGDAEKVDINNNWINVLWQSYKKGEIPSR